MGGVWGGGSFFITLISLGTQIGGTQTRYTVVSFGLNQPLGVRTMSAAMIPLVLILMKYGWKLQ